jgi:hypothetical protein
LAQPLPNKACGCRERFSGVHVTESMMCDSCHWRLLPSMHKLGSGLIGVSLFLGDLFFNRESDVFVTIRRCSCCYRWWKHILLDRSEQRENGGGSGNKSERASTEPVARGYPRAVAEVIGDDDARRRRREPLTCWGPPPPVLPCLRPVLPRGAEGERSLSCGGAGGHQTGARVWGRYKGPSSSRNLLKTRDEGKGRKPRGAW